MSKRFNQRFHLRSKNRMTSRKRPRTVAPNSAHTALTDRFLDRNARCAIITLHTVLPDRPLHPENWYSEKALGSRSKQVEFRALGAGGIERMRAVVTGSRCPHRHGATLYGVATRRRLKTIEAGWLAR
eukprot:scaffold60023_cov42-Phaeocystis_antarctica.AAC.1